MDNKSLIKWLLILGSAPIWVPFLRALWQDLRKALREEGGLWGPTPGEREVEAMRRERAREEPEVVHEPLERPGSGRAPRAPRRPGAPPPRGGRGGGSLRREGGRRGL
jgi:hypothetical protein